MYECTQFLIYLICIFKMLIMKTTSSASACIANCMRVLETVSLDSDE